MPYWRSFTSAAWSRGRSTASGNGRSRVKLGSEGLGSGREGLVAEDDGTPGGTTPPPPPPGTRKISEDIAAPMRALYPGLKRAHLDYLARLG